MTDTPPDHMSTNPRSPHFDMEVLQRGIGIRFKGKERTDVEEYSISEGWIRVAAGLARARIVPGTREAEYAILLGSYVAGLGLGRHLMQKLVKWSRGRYLDRLYGDTPGSNEPMLELAASMGFRPSNERGVPAGLTRLVLDL